jgi:hypothetical protein
LCFGEERKRFVFVLEYSPVVVLVLTTPRNTSFANTGPRVNTPSSAKMTLISNSQLHDPTNRFIYVLLSLLLEVYFQSRRELVAEVLVFFQFLFYHQLFLWYVLIGCWKLVRECRVLNKSSNVLKISTQCKSTKSNL